MPLTIVAQLRARQGRGGDLEARLRALVPPTRAEDGCRAYDLHRSLEDEALFHLHEIWESEPLWQAHMQAPHLAAFGEVVEDLVAEWTLYKLERIA